MSNLSIHSFLPRSLVNGPGARCVLHLQGCSLKCPGCFNKALWDPKAGRETPIHEIAEWVVEASNAAGLTISGGEPLDQRQGVLELLEIIHARKDCPVIVFSGYEVEEIKAMPDSEKLARHIDAIIAGRFDASRMNDRDLKGSTNKTLWLLTDRYSERDFNISNRTELLISTDGKIHCTGFPSSELHNLVNALFAEPRG